MKTAIIGDVHGCSVELRELLNKLNVDRYIFVGDLVDKGPDSFGVLQLVRELGDKAIVVEGNHEMKNFKFWKKMEAGDEEAAMSVKTADDLLRVHSTTDQETKEWLKTKTVPYFRDGFTVVHGGILPSVVDLPSDPSELSGKNKKRVLRSMFIRYLNEKGNMVAYGEEEPHFKLWAETYDGRFGHVFFGHQPFLQDGPAKFDFATGLDLGCVHGGKLCAAIIEPHTPVYFETVDAKEVYCDPLSLD